MACFNSSDRQIISKNRKNVHHNRKPNKNIQCDKLSLQSNQVSYNPSIEEQLDSLPPSREIIDFYRKKLSLYEKEYDILIERVKTCINAYEEDITSKIELEQIDNERFTLRKTVSDLQVYVHKERNQVLKLHAENDSLKLQLAKDRKVINFLLRLCGTSENHIYYLMRSGLQVEALDPSQLQHHVSAAENSSELDDNGIENDKEILTFKINNLVSQLNDVARINQDEIQSLHQDRELSQREREKDHENQQNQIKILTERLNITQINLCNMTREVIETKKELHKKEEAWLIEKATLKQRKSLSQENSEDISISVKNPGQRDIIKGIKEQLQKKDYHIKLYKEQCASLQRELWNVNQTRDKAQKLLQEHVDKMAQELSSVKKRYESLCRQKSQHLEGLTNELQILKQRLRSLERKIQSSFYNITVPIRKEAIDTARETIVTSKVLQKELHQFYTKLVKLGLDSIKISTE